MVKPKHDKILISHGGYCGRCFACLNGLSQAHCTDLAGGGARAGSSTSAIKFFVDDLAPVERKNDSQSGWAAMGEKNLKILGTIDSRRIDRPGIIRTPRNKEVQRMWDVVATQEFPMTEAEEAFKIPTPQRCGKILRYPHGLPSTQGEL
jgi:hypothetical protein